MLSFNYCMDCISQKQIINYQFMKSIVHHRNFIKNISMDPPPSLKCLRLATPLSYTIVKVDYTRPGSRTIIWDHRQGRSCVTMVQVKDPGPWSRSRIRDHGPGRWSETMVKVNDQRPLSRSRIWDQGQGQRSWTMIKVKNMGQIMLLCH